MVKMTKSKITCHYLPMHLPILPNVAIALFAERALTDREFGRRSGCGRRHLLCDGEGIPPQGILHAHAGLDGRGCAEVGYYGQNNTTGDDEEC